MESRYWVTQTLSQICTVICVSVLGRLRDLQYIFAVSSGSPSITGSFTYALASDGLSEYHFVYRLIFPPPCSLVYLSIVLYPAKIVRLGPSLAIVLWQVHLHSLQSILLGPEPELLTPVPMETEPQIFKIEQINSRAHRQNRQNRYNSCYRDFLSIPPIPMETEPQIFKIEQINSRVHRQNRQNRYNSCYRGYLSIPPIPMETEPQIFKVEQINSRAHRQNR